MTPFTIQIALWAENIDFFTLFCFWSYSLTLGNGSFQTHNLNIKPWQFYVAHHRKVSCSPVHNKWGWVGYTFFFYQIKNARRGAKNFSTSKINEGHQVQNLDKLETSLVDVWEDNSIRSRKVSSVPILTWLHSIFKLPFEQKILAFSNFFVAWLPIIFIDIG